MKSLLRFVSFCLFGFGTPLNAQAQGDDPNRFVLEGKEAVLVLPAELIAAPTVKRVYPSSDGYRLLILREKIKVTPQILTNLTEGQQKTPDGENELIYWNARTRIARSVWKGELFENDITEVAWLPQTDAVFMIIHTLPSKAELSNPNPNAPIPLPQWKLFKATEGQIRATEIPVANLGIGGMLSLTASKTQPLILLQVMQENNAPPSPDGISLRSTTTYLIRKDGRIDLPLNIPNADSARMILPTWDKAGNPLLYSIPEDGKGQHFSVDPKTLAVVPIEAKFEPQDDVPTIRNKAGVLSLTAHKTMVSLGESQKAISTLWLESSVQSEAPRIVLSGDATEGNLLPKGDGAFYQSQGALWYTPFVRLNQAQFLAMRKAALKQVAISNAKQAGLGLLMYAQDYDETFPGPDGVKDKVMPYVKNESLLENFVYTYAGGKLSDIDKPAETILGYMAGPGGRANIFADGHVKWKDDPGPQK